MPFVGLDYIWYFFPFNLPEDKLVRASCIGTILSIFWYIVATFTFSKFLVEFADAACGCASPLVGIEQWQKPTFYLIETDGKDDAFLVCFVEIMVNILQKACYNVVIDISICTRLIAFINFLNPEWLFFASIGVNLDNKIVIVLQCSSKFFGVTMRKNFCPAARSFLHGMAVARLCTRLNIGKVSVSLPHLFNDGV